MNNKLTQCISIKNVVWKSPRLLSCVEIKKKMFLLSNSNKGLFFEQSCVTQLVNDIMSFLCWVYVLVQTTTTLRCPSNDSHYVHASADDHPEQPRHPQCIHSTILPWKEYQWPLLPVTCKRRTKFRCTVKQKFCHLIFDI